MKAYKYILSKQVQWAKSKGIKLFGSKINKGRPAYTEQLNDNLFEPLDKNIRKDFEKGDGAELTTKDNKPCKMQAVHSSSALSVNIFQYWKKINQISEIASACQLCNINNKRAQKIRFEAKFQIDTKFNRKPNIDVVIENSYESKFKIYAIECKFSEAYSSRGHSGIDPKYLELKELWNDIPNLFDFAKLISPNDKEFKHLHPAQLIKHILGLKNKYGKNKFRLLYLWYDCLGYESAKHRDEINKFMDVAHLDNIYFYTLSFQELIIKLSDKYRNRHEKYINYIASRYL